MLDTYELAKTAETMDKMNKALRDAMAVVRKLKEQSREWQEGYEEAVMIIDEYHEFCTELMDENKQLRKRLYSEGYVTYGQLFRSG